jgi:hypothetical protein
MYPVSGILREGIEPPLEIYALYVKTTEVI